MQAIDGFKWKPFSPYHHTIARISHDLVTKHTLVTFLSIGR